jgi:hypothetical protein
MPFLFTDHYLSFTIHDIICSFVFLYISFRFFFSFPFLSSCFPLSGVDLSSTSILNLGYGGVGSKHCFGVGDKVETANH